MNPTTNRAGTKRLGSFEFYGVPILLALLAVVIDGMVYDLFAAAGFNGDLAEFLAALILAPILVFYLKRRERRSPGTFWTEKETRREWFEIGLWGLLATTASELVVQLFEALGRWIPFFSEAILRHDTMLEEDLFQPDTPLGIIFLSTVIAAPLIEELLLRGVFLGAYQTRMAPKWAILTSALIFSLIHMDVLQGAYTLVLGLIAGYAYFNYRHILAPILIHVIFNLLGGFVPLWLEGSESDLLDGLYYYGQYVWGAVALFLLIVFRRRDARPPSA